MSPTIRLAGRTPARLKYRRLKEPARNLPNERTSTPTFFPFPLFFSYCTLGPGRPAPPPTTLLTPKRNVYSKRAKRTNAPSDTKPDAHREAKTEDYGRRTSLTLGDIAVLRPLLLSSLSGLCRPPLVTFARDYFVSRAGDSLRASLFG